MTRPFPALVAVLSLLSGCTPPEPETCSLTGAECGPDDPVRNLSIPPCLPAL